MEYRVVTLTRSHLEEIGVKMFTSREMYQILKRAWVDPTFVKVLGDCATPVFIATERAYFKQNYKKATVKILKNKTKSIGSIISAITPQEFYDLRVIILPPLSHLLLTRKELRHLWQLCLKDFSTNGLEDANIGPMGVDWFDVNSLTMRKGTIKQYLQGGKSVVRQQIIIPKVRALRAQITCDFNVGPTDIILPRKFASEFKMSPHPLYDPQKEPIWRELSPEMGIIVKRDPAIHQASISLINRIQFSDSDLLVVSPLTMVNKNADIDGDTYSIYPIYSRVARTEMETMINPQKNMYMRNISRLMFCQMHILHLHNNLDKLPPPYASLAMSLQEEELGHIQKSQFHYNFYHKYFDKIMTIEEFQFRCLPTSKILKTLARQIYTRYGDAACFDFFSSANKLVIDLAKTQTYYVGLNLLCVSLLSIAASGAKSSLESYGLLLDKLYNLDASYILEPILNTISFDQEKYQNVINDMASSSRLVPKNGYNWYKMDLEWRNIQLGNFGNVYYGGKFLTNLTPLLNQDMITRSLYDDQAKDQIYNHPRATKRALIHKQYDHLSWRPCIYTKGLQEKHSVVAKRPRHEDH